jgi:hypothetical protein
VLALRKQSADCSVYTAAFRTRRKRSSEQNIRDKYRIFSNGEAASKAVYKFTLGEILCEPKCRQISEPCLNSRANSVCASFSSHEILAFSAKSPNGWSICQTGTNTPRIISKFVRSIAKKQAKPTVDHTIKGSKRLARPEGAFLLGGKYDLEGIK